MKKDILTKSGYAFYSFVVLFKGFKPRCLAALLRGYSLEIPVRTIDEPRYLVIGTIEGKLWSGVITYRGDKVRIISMRRSRKEEVKIYESESA
jgi:Ribonuclease toxin, BrnT, of type II toxin-antitoxin system